MPSSFHFLNDPSRLLLKYGILPLPVRSDNTRNLGIHRPNLWSIYYLFSCGYNFIIYGFILKTISVLEILHTAKYKNPFVRTGFATPKISVCLFVRFQKQVQNTYSLYKPAWWILLFQDDFNHYVLFAFLVGLYHKGCLASFNNPVSTELTQFKVFHVSRIQNRTLFIASVGI